MLLELNEQWRHAEFEQHDAGGKRFLPESAVRVIVVLRLRRPFQSRHFSAPPSIGAHFAAALPPHHLPLSRPLSRLFVCAHERAAQPHKTPPDAPSSTRASRTSRISPLGWNGVVALSAALVRLVLVTTRRLGGSPAHSLAPRAGSPPCGP